ncbi:MAG: hypothetical protein WCY54_05420, partial [Syntrophales bacterium]
NQTFIDYFKKHVKSMPDTVCIVDPLNKEALTGFKPEKLNYRKARLHPDRSERCFYALLVLRHRSRAERVPAQPQ